MPEKDVKTPKISMSNTKQEMLEAYNRVLKELKEKEKAELEPRKKVELKKQEKVIKTTDTLTADGVFKAINDLKIEIGKILSQLPEKLEEEIGKYNSIKQAIEIKENELKIDTFRAGGHGGQNVNKLETAVRITHLPTKITVSCQNERSQFKNKELALKILRAKLYQHYQEREMKKEEERRVSEKEIAWGSQIRSYIFQPYQLVKDHRTGVEITDVQKVMDGKIDAFLEAELKEVHQ